MRFLFAAVSGFALTVGIFVSGVAFAVSFLSADPVTVQRTAIDPNPEFLAEVRKVDVSAQEYERVKPAPTRRAINDKAGARVDAEGTVTSTLSDEPLHAINPEHVAWCERRYRSYDPQTNSYRPYSGGTRECMSPFSKAPVAEPRDGIESAAFTEPFDQADIGTVSLDARHLASCSSRYRSYRAEDNTYQPYGGGPRIACE